MPQESERPRPHGDPLAEENAESNPAQRQSDAPPDVAGSSMVEEGTHSGSTANGISPHDDDAGEQRKKLYEAGATLVSRID